MNADELAPARLKRDQWDRPLIMQPTGELIAYTRVSTIADQLDSEASLSKWKVRMTGAGLSRRPDLIAAIASHLDPSGDIPMEHRDAIQRWCKDAMEVAAASAGSNTGTALHKYTETLDRTGSVHHVLDHLKADVEAYQEIMEGIEIVSIEQFVVLDDWMVAGTYDRLLCFDDELYVGDLKTTQNIKYTHRHNAVQMAAYSRGTPYHEHRRGVSLPEQGVNQERGLVISLPAGTGRAAIYMVDLEAGWEAFQHSCYTHDWRKHTPAELIMQTGPSSAKVRAKRKAEPEAESTKIVIDWIKRRIAALPGDAKQTLANVWPDVPGFKDDHVHTMDELQQIINVIDQVETYHGIGFGETDPRETSTPRLVVPEPRPQPVHEVWENEVSDYANLADAKAVHAAVLNDFTARPLGVQAKITGWLREAHEAGCSFSISACTSKRRIAILNACYTVIEHLGADDLILGAINAVTGATPPTIGAGLGRLTFDQAAKLSDFAIGVSRGEVVLLIELDGKISYTNPTEQKADQT